MQDVVLVFVTVSGLREGKLMQEVFTRKIFRHPRPAGRAPSRPPPPPVSVRRWTCSAKAGCRPGLHPAGADRLAGFTGQPLRAVYA
jgi:hypothetical protein